jgi:heme-degrading monooxygenase HmoA
MVRVIVEHQAKDTEKLIDVIRELRNEAMKQRGFITGETLVNADNAANVLVISTWQNLEDWNAWDKSDLRLEITKRVNALLTEPYTVKIYHYYTVRQDRVRSIF